jgi:hypothetical protein
MLARLGEARSLGDSEHGSGFLSAIARLYPRRVFDLLINRVARQTTEHQAGRTDYEAMPCRFQTLEGIEDDPGFEALARDVFQRIFNAPPDQRWCWEELFHIAVSRTSALTGKLISERLPQIDNARDLADIASLLGFEGSLMIFRHPQLTGAILHKARSLGADVHERITWNLIHGAGPGIRGYTNGQLDSEYRYLRDEAEKAARTHESNRILGPFYQKIVEMETRDVQWHRKELEDDLSDDW